MSYHCISALKQRFGGIRTTIRC